MEVPLSALDHLSRRFRVVVVEVSLQSLVFVYNASEVWDWLSYCD